MAAIVGGWAFACFVGYRILTQALFDDPLSILACILSAVVTAGIVFAATGFYSLSGLKTSARIRQGGSGEGWFGQLLGPFVIACGANVVAGFGLAFGFSERFYRNMGDYYYDFFEAPWFIWMCILLLPIFVHLAMITISIKAQVKFAKETKDSQ